MTVALEELAALADSAPFHPRLGSMSGWSVDTRTLERGDVFFALRGPHHDGHDHVRAAIEKGAAALVVERAVEGGNAIVVRDTLEYLQKVAAWARRKWGGKIVGVTGSAGKTTTKDVIAALLGSHMAVGKTVGNLNNHVGVPLSILRLPDEARVGVLEMGMNHAGEIRALAEIARPEIGVVTNVGYAHVEYFDSIDAVALAKRELIDSLPADGVAVLNADDPRVTGYADRDRFKVITFGFSEGADVRAEEVRFERCASQFRVGNVEFESSLAGRHGVMNLLAGIAVARIFGIAAGDLREAVRSFTPGKMRGERLEHAGITVLNDCYNSNPEATRAMLDVLGAAPARRRTAVLGEMLELGRSAEPLHRGVGKYAADRGIDVLIGVRGAARHMVDEAVKTGMSDGGAYFFEDPAAAGEFVRGVARKGDAILFKGSRGVQVERALERFLEEPPRD